MDIFSFMGQMLPQETEVGLGVLGIFSTPVTILTMILKKDNELFMDNLTLWTAPFSKPLKIRKLNLSEDSKRILMQMGLDEGDTVEKLHSAPLGEPVSVLIGAQQFALRKDICKNIFVELA